MIAMGKDDGLCSLSMRFRGAGGKESVTNSANENEQKT